MQRKLPPVNTASKGAFLEFAVQQTLKTLLFIGLLLIGLWMLKNTLPPEMYASIAFPDVHPMVVFSVFFASESLLGMLPPDLWILWAMQFDWFWVTIYGLAMLSYAGGIISYKIGRKIGHYPFVQKMLNKTFARYKPKIEEWGGFVIVLAALTPLPFSPISLLAGSLKYNFRSYLLFASTRVPRYFIYAWAILQIIVT